MLKVYEYMDFVKTINGGGGYGLMASQGVSLGSKF
jgi:hypothetical protein